MVDVKSARRRAFSFGWDSTVENFEFLVHTYILYAFLLLIPGALLILTVLFALMGDYPLAVVFGIIMLISGAIISISLYIGYLKIALLICDDEPVSITDLRPTVDEFSRTFQTIVLYLIIVGIGFLLLIIPGIIWSIKYYPCVWLVLDEGVGPVEALRKSADITRESIWELFIFGLQCMLVLGLGLLLCFIGIIAAAPTVLFAATFTYRELAETAPVD